MSELGIRKAVQDLRKQDICICGGFLKRDTRFQSSEDVKRFRKVFVAALPTRQNRRQHRKWSPHVWCRANSRTKKLARRYTHNIENSAPELDLMVQDRSIAAETTLPERIAEHEYRMRTFRGIVVLIDHSPDL